MELDPRHCVENAHGDCKTARYADQGLQFPAQRDAAFMILAGIDVGTNTLRLLIADIEHDSFREIHSDRKITRLGQRLDTLGYLSSESQQRSITCLAAFSRTIGKYAVSGVAAVGTSALRKASNAAEFIKM